MNALAKQVAEALTREHPEFASQPVAGDHGDVELHVPAPPHSHAGALVVCTARGEDIWVRFAPPQMAYPVDDVDELLQVVNALLNDRVVFVRCVDAQGNWVETTLAETGTNVELEFGQRASTCSWSGANDREARPRNPETTTT